MTIDLNHVTLRCIIYVVLINGPLTNYKNLISATRSSADALSVVDPFLTNLRDAGPGGPGPVPPFGHHREVAGDVFMQPGDGVYKDSALRDVEHLEHSSLWGHKYMGGGAGEGTQFLSPSGIFPNKQEVKTDAVLPAYCDPPNPCPLGATADDGCLEEFENTATFSRRYQANQDCLCDEDHMFSCPSHHRKAIDSVNDASEIEFQSFLDSILNKADIKDQHKGLVAKKFHEKKRRVKRKAAISRGTTVAFNRKLTPNNETTKISGIDRRYWAGERLSNHVAKKRTEKS